MRQLALNTPQARALLEGLEGPAPAAPPTEEQLFERQMALLQRQIDRLRVESRLAEAAPGSGESADEGTSASEGSSREGEESGDQEEPAAQQAQRAGQMVHFTAKSGERLAVFRAVLPSLGLDPATLLSHVARLARVQTWTFFILHGGHFGAAVYRNGSVIAHKTLHRYVIRAKRGTLQSTRDRSGGKPRSFGASLRRHNETMLHEEIVALIASWRSHLAESDLVFLQTSAVKRSVFFGTRAEPGPLDRADSRIRSVPFETHRPTLAEIDAVHARLFALYDLPDATDEVDEIVEPAARLAASPTDQHTHARTASIGSRGSEQSQAALSGHEGLAQPGDRPYVDAPLFTAAAAGDGPAITRLLVEGADPLYAWNAGACTALHAAARADSVECITALLAGGCDPAITNARGQTPYMVAKTREARNAFRRFMADAPDAFDYHAAQIPSALTAEKEDEQARKVAERNRERRKKAKQAAKKKAAREAEAAAQVEQAKQQVPAPAAAPTPALSPAEQARELRAAAALQRRTGPPATTPSTAETATGGSGAGIRSGGPPLRVCIQCGAACPPKTFYSRLSYFYCTAPCMRAHRAALGD